MAITSGFSGYYRAQIAIVGNSLVVGNGGISGIRYITPDEGTTTDYTLNGSTGVFNLPAGSNVIFAELVLASVSFTVNASSTFTFTTPTQTVDLGYGTLATEAWQAYYQDVTSLVQDGGSGTYMVSRVNGSTASLMWFLFIVYENPSYDINYINYFRGVDATLRTLTLNNVFTPETGQVEAIMLKGLTGSDYNDNGTTRLNGNLIGNTSNPWDGSSPYNPDHNIAPGVINVANPSESDFGLIDTRGTFGNANNDAYARTAPNPNRTWGDITGIDVSDALDNGIDTVVMTETFTGGWFTNIVAFQISAELVIIEPEKTVDKSRAPVGDTLTYTLVYTNTGNSTASNVTIIDTIPNATSFVTDSVTVNGVSQPATSPLPPSGINVGILAPDETTTITFNVDIINGVGTTINNSFNITYDSDEGRGSVVSNTVPTAIIANPITTTKSVDKAFSTRGDTLEYTLVISNSATTPSSDTILVDTLPDDVTFIDGSLEVNNNQNPGNPSPPSGVNIGAIPAGGSLTITFDVSINSTTTVNNLLNDGYFSTNIDGFNFEATTNTVVTTISFLELSSVKSVDKEFANINDILTYTIVIENNGNTTAQDIVFLDTIPNGTTFVENSLSQDGQLISQSPEPPGANLINPISANGITTITFDVIVDTIPQPNPIPNTATINAEFIIDPNTQTMGEVPLNTNEVLTQVNNVSLRGITKSVDKTFASCGDIVVYTISLPNSGTTTASNVVLTDTIPNGTSFIENSVIINGVSAPGEDPSTGINVGTISAGSVSTVSFSVLVNC